MAGKAFEPLKAGKVTFKTSALSGGRTQDVTVALSRALDYAESGWLKAEIQRLIPEVSDPWVGQEGTIEFWNIGLEWVASKKNEIALAVKNFNEYWEPKVAEDRLKSEQAETLRQAEEDRLTKIANDMSFD
jgi:hypothetical protein